MPKASMVASVLALTVAGCFDRTMEVYVTKDGSGTITETVYVSQRVATMLETVSRAAEKGDEQRAEAVAEAVADMVSARTKPETRPATTQPKPAKKGIFAGLLTNQGVARAMKVMGEGVSLKSAKEIKHQDGRPGYRTVCVFKDISKVKIPIGPDELDNARALGRGTGPGAAAGKPVADEKKKAEGIRFRFEKGAAPKLTILQAETKKEKVAVEPGAAETRPAGEEAPVPPGRKEAEEKTMREMALLFKDMRLCIRVKVAGRITKTNATYVNEARDCVTLIKVEFGKIFLADKKLMKELERRADGPDFDFGTLKAILNRPEFRNFAKFELEPKVEVVFRPGGAATRPTGPAGARRPWGRQGSRESL